jgi:hypothetical protein
MGTTPLNGIAWGVCFAGISSILDAETGFEGGRVVTTDDYQLKYVGIVATIIGAVVLFLGFVGLIINLS